MKHRYIAPIIFLSITIAISLSACKGVGIFAFVATTDKINKGNLPEGTGASKILQIANEYNTTFYSYFSSGNSLYYRLTQNRSDTSKRWTRISLPSGWTNIQSITTSDDHLLVALSRFDNTTSKSGLFLYNDTDKFTAITINDNILDSSSSQYVSILLYAPQPSADTDTFYVNVLKFNGTFGLDSTFNGSDLYIIDDGATSMGNVDKQAGQWATTLQSSYISGTAYGRNTYRFTTINPSDNTGLLTDQTGTQIPDSSTLPFSGITWLEGDDGVAWNGTGAFIMGSTKLSGSSYPIYISTDGTTTATWATLTSSYIVTSFLDVTGTEAGGDSDGNYDAPDDLILAGTRNIGQIASAGYIEIVATDADVSKWILRTSQNNFTFSQTRTYIASDLSDDSIVGLSLFTDSTSGDQFVYASTDTDGVWSINADDQTKHDNGSLVWSRE